MIKAVDLDKIFNGPAQQATIRENECIGCTKCITACPFDAIVGANKHMHHVLAHECTGCSLCVEPCPVDCIDMVALPERAYEPDLAKERFRDKGARTLQAQTKRRERYFEKRALATQNENQSKDKKAKQAYIQHALDRVKAKRHEQTKTT